ncbi:MAG: leader peptidase (prepilin peptidase)/N-methyltransferase [Halioglobus sp.]|jgi:leader peptidase (prepilin peptidase)/N-methyltransferase
MLEALNQHPWMLATALLFMGLIVGSFLNVVIYRLPIMMESQWRKDCCELLEVEEKQAERKINLAVPNSHCPKCGDAIKAWQNIPVLSYLVLAGKCYNCQAKISIRYPIIELISGVMTLSLMLYFDASLALLGAMLFTWALITLTMIDVDQQLLPDDITLPLLWLGLLLNVNGTFVSLESAVIGAAAGYLSLWSVFWLFKLLTGKDGMGYGDFKLLAALGAWMGWQAIPLIVLLSSVVGAIVGIALMVLQRRGKDIPIPFGPYLAMAGWISLLWGDELIALYLGATGITA